MRPPAEFHAKNLFLRPYRVNFDLRFVFLAKKSRCPRRFCRFDVHNFGLYREIFFDLLVYKIFYLLDFPAGHWGSV
jgi:hypothetical protein